MQLRTQLVVVGLVAAGWFAGTLTVVQPATEASATDRASMARLESQLARDPSDRSAARALARRYLTLGMPQNAVDAVTRSAPEVQRDAQVSLALSRAYERLGDVHSAAAQANGALGRCVALPPELSGGEGCDVRTNAELALQSEALDRMIAWRVDPVRDPLRARDAHELAGHPVRLGAFH